MPIATALEYEIELPIPETLTDMKRGGKPPRPLLTALGNEDWWDYLIESEVIEALPNGKIPNFKKNNWFSTRYVSLPSRPLENIFEWSRNF